MNKVKVGSFSVGGNEPLVLLAGPCALESLDRCLYIGRTIKEICGRLGVPYVFKASFDKANRSSFHSFRGPGMEKGIEMLGKIKAELQVPIVTDIHDTGLSLPSDRPSSCGSRDRQGGQCQEGAIPFPDGYAECGGQAPRERE